MTAPSATDRPLAVVTGATGFLGSHVVDTLLARGWRVRAAVRPTSDLRWLQGKPVRTVLPGESAEGTARLLADARAVIHCAGVVSARDEAAYFAGNVAPTDRLIAAAATTPGLRAFVLISSLAAGGPSRPDRPRREDDPPAPVSAYGRSKLAGERLLTPDLPFRWAILRPPALYGPRDAAFLPLFAWARRGWTVSLRGGMAALSLMDGRDCAAAAVTLLETERAGGLYQVDDGRAYGWDDIAAALREALGRRVRAVPVPLGVLRLAARLAGAAAARAPLLRPERLASVTAPAWTGDGSRLRETTGFRAERDLARGFRETWAFFREAGWL
ncbi:MAG: NAD-dependent epimerase/dehydratase family protein [Candidatus Krumholzibacteriia bacterium]